MDQADGEPGQHASPHDRVLHEIMSAIRALTANMCSLEARVDQVCAYRPVSPATAASTHGPLAAPSAPVATSLREPNIPHPARYGGEPGSCGQFLHQCSLVFDQQPLTYSSDRSRVAFVMSLLTGKAAAWSMAISNQYPEIRNTFPGFVEEMRKTILSLSASSLQRAALTTRLYAVSSGGG
ncbi:protein LDOC1-like [Corythoichthys intestinalis]|uniref:protein LDOC1-like n=1 Tax=Corythoichthys intestinalis TaxID=161448 RepID=UPI0025A65B9F|nr:protein LDOC1-like [Corythoichthys intestinalis]